MKNSPSKIALTVGFLLALSFTFSCTGGGSGDDGGSSSSGGGASKNNCTDAASCKKKKIGNRTWMLENLNIDVGEGSTCYEGKSANCDKYGRLYTWAAAMDIDSKYNEQLWGESDVRHQGICPTGWHIPSFAEWEALGNKVETLSGCTGCAGKHLKSISYWKSYSGIQNLDTYGFNARPGGYCDENKANPCASSVSTYFKGIEESGRWWTSTENMAGSAFPVKMSYYSNGVEMGMGYPESKGYLYSVRCVKN